MTNTNKFEVTVDYLIHTSPNSIFSGATKINKVLWAADVTAYKKIGRSITGSKYIRRQNGPVPETILRTLKNLNSKGRIQIVEPTAQYEPRTYIGLASDVERCDWDQISAAEREILHSQILRLNSMNTTQMSDETHGPVWESLENGQEMPLSAMLVDEEGEYTPAVFSWAQSQIAQISR